MTRDQLLALDSSTVVKFTQPIENPRPDRRSKSDWRKAVVLTPRRFTVVIQRVDATLIQMMEEHGAALTPEEKILGVRLVPTTGKTYQDVLIHREPKGGRPTLGAALLPHLLVVSALRVGDLVDSKLPATGILAMLVEQGVVTLDAIKEAQDAYTALDEPAWQEFNSKHGI